MKKFFSILKSRWRNHMPTFFRRVFWVCSLISGTSLAVNTAITMGGGYTHQWWQDIYQYLLGVPAGMAFVCKFTQQYNGKPIGYDEYKQANYAGRTVLDRDVDELDGTPPPPYHPHFNQEERQTVHTSQEEPYEIEPYDDRPNA